MTKWAIELGERDITYKPQISIKGLALAGFMAEMSDDPHSSMMTTPKDVDKPPKAPTQETKEMWRLHTARASSKDGSGVGIVLTSPYGDK